jgi:mRNA-degrading endonuclease RelE of RelBE toxin-antitoxin system
MVWPVLTLIESPIFSKIWLDYWSVDEHGEFVAYLASNPEAGDLIPGSGGCRKIRWARSGMGKRGGVRVIYTVRLKRGAIVLLTIYAKNVRDDIPSHVLRQIAEELDHD